MYPYVNSNINKSFMPNKPIIDSTDYDKSQRNVLHNNLQEKLLYERIVEYRLLINTIDRDIDMCPSIFNVKLSCGNNNSALNVRKNFRNVKYVTINSVILPRTISIDTTKTTIINSLSPDYQNIFPTSSINAQIPASPALTTNNILFNLENQPYLILKIKELETEYSLSTSQYFDKDQFVLIPDQKLGDQYLWKPRRNTVVYPNSLLFNINMLTFEIFAFDGNKLSIYDHLGNDIMTNYIDPTVPYNFNSYIKTYGTNNKATNYTNNVTQIVYDITLGIVENELSTSTKFD